MIEFALVGYWSVICATPEPIDIEQIHCDRYGVCNLPDGFYKWTRGRIERFIYVYDSVSYFTSEEMGDYYDYANRRQITLNKDDIDIIWKRLNSI